MQQDQNIDALVTSLSLSPAYTFHKATVSELKLLVGQGVEGDVHCGEKVKHRSRVAKNPDQPNLRQVHLLHEELFYELESQGFSVKPGQLGENITTKNIDLLSLPTASKLYIGETIIEITGLRNPCYQLDNFQQGLTQAVLDKDENGNLIRKAGVMGVVLKGGSIKLGDKVAIEFPEKPHRPLQKV